MSPNSPSSSSIIFPKPLNLAEHPPCTPNNWNPQRRNEQNTTSSNMSDPIDPTEAIQAATLRFQRETSSNASGTRNTGVAPASLFYYNTPEPPPIHVPSPEHGIYAPTFDGVCGDDLTEADLRVITQTEFTPVDNTSQWTYEMRRKAQKILPFLYLGPWEVVKTQMDFLRSEEISMLLVVRNTTTARAGIMSPKKHAEALGILYDSIDVESNQELITAFPRAIKIINNHLVNCYRQQVQAANFIPGRSPLRIGKIFLYCESGNDRSAAIAVAYVLAMYNVSLLYSLQFIQAQRFCISIDEPLKHYLSAYEEILKAQRMVHVAQKQLNPTQQPQAQSSLATLGLQNLNVSQPSNTTAAKRCRSRDEDDEMDDDQERFQGRSAFQPFVQED